ncbi:MAG: hypothetical protein IKL65_05170 [Bacilli bacterium]|nr:hypothetical protein [Bacilli bacterium]
MKKKNNKGFMLAETLVVTAFVAGVLIFLFIQFSNLSNAYDDSYIYNTSEGLYALEDIKDYINSDTAAKTYVEKSLDSVDYIDISDCSIFSDKKYCENLFEIENIENIIIANNIDDYDNYFDSYSNLVCELVDDADKSGTITIGDKYSCDPGDGVNRIFYVLEDGDNTTLIKEDTGTTGVGEVSLIMDSNLNATTTWCSYENYYDGENCGADGVYSSITKNTSNWVNVDVTAPTAYQIARVSGDLEWEKSSTPPSSTLPSWLSSGESYWTSTNAAGGAGASFGWIVGTTTFNNNSNMLGIDDIIVYYSVRPVITLAKKAIIDNKNIEVSYPESLKAFLNKIDNTGEEPYRVIASFKNGTYATLRFGDIYE